MNLVANCRHRDAPILCPGFAGSEEHMKAQKSCQKYSMTLHKIPKATGSTPCLFLSKRLSAIGAKLAPSTCSWLPCAFIACRNYRSVESGAAHTLIVWRTDAVSIDIYIYITVYYYEYVYIYLYYIYIYSIKVNNWPGIAHHCKYRCIQPGLQAGNRQQASDLVTVLHGKVWPGSLMFVCWRLIAFRCFSSLLDLLGSFLFKIFNSVVQSSSWPSLICQAHHNLPFGVRGVICGKSKLSSRAFGTSPNTSRVGCSSGDTPERRWEEYLRSQ